MAEYKIQDILDPTFLSGKTAIKEFINSCKQKQLENVTPILLDTGKTTAPKKTALFKTLEDNKEEPLCYDVTYKGKSYITFYRKALEILTKSKSKAIFTNKTINGLLSKLTNQYTPGNFFELISSNDNKTTSEKQDFTCYAVWYFFNDTTASIYDFYEHIKQTNDLLSNNKSKLSVSSTSAELKEFSLLINYPYVLDSVTVAKTLIAHRGKLNITGSLSAYNIAEEDSAEGIRYKSVPFKKIALTESNYYNAPDKLTTADIFLYKPQSPGLKKLNLVFSGRTLTHKQYQKFIDTGFKDGDIIPISLKQLKLTTVSENLTTNLVKVIGSLNEVEEEVKDPFFSTVLSLMAIKDKQEFIKRIEEVIDINQNSFDYKLKEVGRTTFEFDISFVDYNKKTRYQAFLQSGQIYLTPIETTGSASGIGGITRDYVNSQIIRRLPERNRLFTSIKQIRRHAFLDKFNITANFTSKEFPGLTYSKPTIKKREELVSEAVKLGISDKRTIERNLNLADKTKRETYEANLIKKIYSASKQNKHMQLVNIAVRFKLADKNDAIQMDIKDLSNMIANSKAYKGFTNYAALNKSDLMSPGDLATIFAQIDESLRPAIARRYIENITAHMRGKASEILQDYEKEFAGKSDFLKNTKPNQTKVQFSNNTKIFFEKLSSYEMLYLCSANEDVIKKWIKNSFIMSVYALAAAYGVIIFNGKTYKLKDQEEFVAGAMIRKNPIYVKIGE
jgi:hypothetical protein